ncbi:MAG: hypothetical protein WC975_11810 [Phycisphaerae bacterium]
MREKKCPGYVCALILLLLMVAIPASAAPIPVPIPLDKDGVQSGWSLSIRSSDLSNNKVFLPTVFNVNLSGDSVTIQLDKQFKGIMSADLFGPITVWFVKTSPSAVNRIIINDEQIINSTDKAWQDFHMQLLVDAIAPEAAFDNSTLPRGDLLPSVSFDSSPAGYLGQPIVLNFKGGTVPNSPFPDNIFNPGHSDDFGGNPFIIQTDAAHLAVGDFFGLKEWPTIPEPLSALFLVIGGLGLARRRN